LFFKNESREEFYSLSFSPSLPPSLPFLQDVAYVNSSHVISQQPKMTAINSCVEIDITGQVVSDSIGPIIYSGVGGQVDFLRGASLSPEGMPILALPSRTNKGIARIVPTIKAGAGVVTPRALVHYVVTEYGIACLFGKTLQVRTPSSLPPLLPILSINCPSALPDSYACFSLEHLIVPPALFF